MKGQYFKGNTCSSSSLKLYDVYSGLNIHNQDSSDIQTKGNVVVSLRRVIGDVLFILLASQGKKANQLLFSKIQERSRCF